MESYQPFKRLVQEHGIEWFGAEVRKFRGLDAPEAGYELRVYPNERPNQIVGTWFSHLYIDGEEVDPAETKLFTGNGQEYYLTEYAYEGDTMNLVEVHFSSERPESVKWTDNNEVEVMELVPVEA